MKDWIYMGLFLDDTTKAFLRRYYTIPKGWKEYIDHVTLAFNDGSKLSQLVKEINSPYIGKWYNVRIDAVGISEEALAIKVNLPLGIVCANKIPHVTIAAECKPVDSNYIEIWNEVHDRVILTGQIRVV